MNFLTKHLKESNLSYLEHLICAWFFDALHIVIVPIALFHGIFPFVLGGLGKKLNLKIRNRYFGLVEFFQKKRNLKLPSASPK